MNGITSQPSLGSLGPSLTVEEAAAELGIPPEEVLRHIRAGDLPHLRVQGHDAIAFRVLPEDVRALRNRLAPVEDTVLAHRGDIGHDDRRENRAGSPLTAETLDDALTKALAPLLVQHERLLDENARLRETLAARAARIAELEAAIPPTAEPPNPEAGERPPLLGELPLAMEELGAQVRALQEELALLRERRQQADDGAFQQAWRRAQRRPWWADLLD